MMTIDGIINGTNGIINQNRGEESMNAVIYARYSSDSQREESIDGQIRECTEYAKRNGIRGSRDMVTTMTTTVIKWATATILCWERRPALRNKLSPEEARCYALKTVT